MMMMMRMMMMMMMMMTTTRTLWILPKMGMVSIGDVAEGGVGEDSGSGHSLYPRGSKYPIFEVSGSKNHTLNGIWDQRP